MSEGGWKKDEGSSSASFSPRWSPLTGSATMSQKERERKKKRAGSRNNNNNTASFPYGRKEEEVRKGE